MSDDTNPPADRYDVSGNTEAQYMDDKQAVMRNKKNIYDLQTLQIEEEQALADAYGHLLDHVRSDTPMTAELIRYTHKTIFGDLYEWAGKWRTVRISKPDAVWPPPDFLDEAMKYFERDILFKYKISGLDKDVDFCRAVGHIQGEFLAIHPFREGNARTLKLFIDLLAAQTKRPILRYDMSANGQRQYIAAAKAALSKKDYLPMQTVIQEALERSMKEFPAS